jgi:hypothetical protein
VLLGHWLSFVRPRGQFSEYACVTCGHPFLFASRDRWAGPRSGQVPSGRTRLAA